MTTFGDRLFENDGVPVGFGDPGMGNVFYVNGGSDGPSSNGGTGARDDPKQTLQAALALCVSGNDDYVMVLNYGSNGRSAESWPVTVTKDQVHIIGLRATRGSKWSVATSGDAGTNAFTVTGQRCEFANLEIGGNTTGSGIQIGNAVWGTTIHNCWFGYADGVGTHGVFVASGADAPYLTVYDNRFGQALTGDGIRIAGNATRGFLGDRHHGNIFRDIAGIAINVSGSAQSLEILDNDFQLLADTIGDAITLSAGTSGCYIAGNQAARTEAAVTTKYYVDAASDANDWGDNYVSGVLLYP
jgi:hypothetical protein